jgi:hypothetical protein
MRPDLTPRRGVAARALCALCALAGLASLHGCRHSDEPQHGLAHAADAGADGASGALPLDDPQALARADAAGEAVVEATLRFVGEAARARRKPAEVADAVQRWRRALVDQRDAHDEAARGLTREERVALRDRLRGRLRLAVRAALPNLQLVQGVALPPLPPPAPSEEAAPPEAAEDVPAEPVEQPAVVTRTVR